MQRYLKYVFPATNTQDVCRTQTLAATGNLTLNGFLTNSINSEIPFISHGYSRNISITSANNLSGVTFTVYGKQNGVDIVEAITGPNNTTVYSAQIYDTISAIRSSGAAAAVSVGTGVNGFMKVDINLETNITNSTVSLFNPQERISTVIYTTPYDLGMLGRTYLALNASTASYFFVIKAAGTEVSDSTQVTAPYRSIFIALTGNTGTTLNDTVTVIFIQV